MQELKVVSLSTKKKKMTFFGKLSRKFLSDYTLSIVVVF